MADVDREIYLRYQELAGQNGERFNILAAEFGMGTRNIERAVEQIQARLRLAAG